MRLSHAETQALISARLDGPLDPVAERELNAHLATCDSCRAFSTSASQLARGLQTLPYLPASPAVTRAVLDHVSTPRSPWSWLAGSFPANALPAASAIAAAVIVVFVGSFAAFRFLDDGDEPSTIPASTLDLAQGSTQVAGATLEPTESANTVAAPTDAVGQHPSVTEEPVAPTGVATTSEAEATEPSALDSTTEPATDDDVEIGPPQTPTPSSGTTDQLRLATDVPEIEPTPQPTDEPAPTEAPVPTVAPTVENTPDPSQNIRRLLGLETAVPTDTPATETTDQPTLTAEASQEPTAAPRVEPTAVPTLEPTAEPTPEPTPIPADEPTAEPTVEAEPTVVPIISREDEAAASGDADESAGDDETGAEADESGSGDDGSNQTLGPSGIDQSIVDPDAAENAEGDDASPDSDQIIQGIEAGEVGGDGGEDEQVIEPTGGEGSGTETDSENAPDDDTGSGLDDKPTQTAPDDALASADVYDAIENVPGGDAGARLGLNPDGELVFSVNPGRVSLESNGILLKTGEGSTGQVVQACDGNGSCVDISATSGTVGGFTDTPIGWLNGEVIYERLNGDDFAVEFRAISLDSGSLQPSEDRLIGGGNADLETMIRPYPVDGALLVPSPSAWLRISTSSVDIVSNNPYGQDLGQIRWNQAAGQISYVSGGTLVLASTSSPGSPILQLAYAGSDYDFSPDGNRIAVVTGPGIDILDTSGNVLIIYPNEEGIALGSLVWLNDGLVFVDLTSGVLRILEP
ncbi:MAG: zf-HC2 domain-containing protein [Chloroflexia bacterium]|nr:zf-HC2 domain-containing protein [Chloroflexia bacterium]